MGAPVCQAKGANHQRSTMIMPFQPVRASDHDPSATDLIFLPLLSDMDGLLDTERLSW